MSNDGPILAMRALLASYESLEVYGQGHSGTQAALKRCAELFGDLLRSATTVTIAFAGGGVVIAGTLLTERWAVDAPFIVKLKKRGVQVVRFTRGVDSSDLVWLFDSSKGPTGTASPSRRILVGQASMGSERGAIAGDGGGGGRGGRDEGGTPSRGFASTSTRGDQVTEADVDGIVLDDAELIEPLKASWDVVLGGLSGKKDVKVATLASRILAATVSNRSRLMPLLDLKNHDEYTFVHVTNVAILSSALGEALGMSGNNLQHLTEAALLHDVGKSVIPKRILGKKGVLDPAERAVVQRHPAAGAMILARVKGVSEMAIVTAYEHHRRLDGKGYPHAHGISRPSVASQIVQVADMFDALRSNRPYRAGMPMDQCIAIMEKEAGRAFDRELFNVFCEQLLMRVPASTILPVGKGGESLAA